MVWPGNAAHQRLNLGSGRNVCPVLAGRALTQRYVIAARLVSATFVIVGAPHMTPYMLYRTLILAHGDT